MAAATLKHLTFYLRAEYSSGFAGTFGVGRENSLQSTEFTISLTPALKYIFPSHDFGHFRLFLSQGYLFKCSLKIHSFIRSLKKRVKVKLESKMEPLHV